MRCAIFVCLSVLMVLGISEARSLNKATASSRLLKGRFLSHFKARNIHLSKKDNEETESTQGSNEGEPKPYPLIVLQVAGYVSSCLANKEVMEKVDNEAWQLLASGSKNSMDEFHKKFSDKDYYDCLLTGKLMHDYVEKPEYRAWYDAIFTVSKEYLKCLEMEYLGSAFEEMKNLDETVEFTAGYMEYHCDERTKQVEGKYSPNEVVSTAAFDAFMFVGECVVDKKTTEECTQAEEGVKAFAYALQQLIYMELGLEEYDDELVQKYKDDIGQLDHVFTQHNKQYTCDTLGAILKNATHLSGIGGQVAGGTAKLLRGILNRECLPEESEDSTDPSEVQSQGKSETSDEQKTEEVTGQGTTKRKLQPVNENIEILKKILADLSKKK